MLLVSATWREPAVGERVIAVSISRIVCGFRVCNEPLHVLPIEHLAGLADHLPKLDACPGAVVQCTVVPSDGVTNGTPYTKVVRIAGVSNGDINCDGGINITDLLLLIADWGSCELCAGDLNNDGETNVHDLLILIGNWG